MRDKCFEIGTIQAFLDGELASDVSENIARHLSLCDDCALLLAEAEEETAFAFSALEGELNTLVPTQRLWLKINDSIEKNEKSFWQKIFAFALNPASLALASLLIVFGLFAAVLDFQKTDNPDASVAVTDSNKQNLIVPVSKTGAAIEQNSIADKLPEIEAAKVKQNKKVFQVVRTSVVKADKSLKNENSLKAKLEQPIVKKTPLTADENSSSDDSYIKTIAALTKTVDDKKDETLKPSARFAFEKDLAVINDAIGKMQSEIKKNPKDETAKEMLRASYQNKIDLLNSVTEKSELMAILK